ncbi:MAG: aminotransferase class V-fold PLP-dependent enzyme [Egibacteraceae bacterium]
MVNNSLGAMPATVRDSLAEFADRWEVRGVDSWGSDWFPEVRRVADLLGSLIGAPAGSVVVHQNVAALTSMVLSALDFSDPRNKVVVTDAEWPSHGYLLEAHRSLGANVEVIPTDGVVVDTERLLAVIDERTLLVPVSHVLFRSAFINDVAAITRRAHDVGALVLVDGYHAVGHMPVDAIDCDFYVGGSVKRLCGGPGVGYLYIRPDRQAQLRPREVGWVGHARPFGFETAWEPASGAMGWLGGTPAMPALYAAREGYEVIRQVGPDRIRATSQLLTTRLVEGAGERGVTVNTPLDPRQRAGTVSLDLGDDTEMASRRLIDAGIVIDYRPRAGIRVGPHFFNTIDECDALLAAL